MTALPANATENGWPLAAKREVTLPLRSSMTTTCRAPVRATNTRCVAGSSATPLSRPPILTSPRDTNEAMPLASTLYLKRESMPLKPRVTYNPSLVQVMPVAKGTLSLSDIFVCSPIVMMSMAPSSCESTASSVPSGDSASELAKFSTGIVKPAGVTARPSGKIAAWAIVAQPRTNVNKSNDGFIESTFRKASQGHCSNCVLREHDWRHQLARLYRIVEVDRAQW